MDSGVCITFLNQLFYTPLYVVHIAVHTISPSCVCTEIHTDRHTWPGTNHNRRRGKPDSVGSSSDRKKSEEGMRILVCTKQKPHCQQKDQ